jgi:hypothetical protein
MNSTNIRRTTATLATATAAVLALGTMSASPALAGRTTPDGGGRTTTVGSSTVPMDMDLVVTMLKVKRAQYLIDHPGLLR